MSNWRDDLRRVVIGGVRLVGASFRGVTFLVESGERSGGRRIVRHEFPLRDDPFVEDLGRKGRGFRVDGYVIGDDYMVQRDALLAALEDVAGPGTLIHPHYSKAKQVACESVSVRESKSEGGVAMFSIEFVEAPLQTSVPTAVPDGAGQVATSADAAVIAAGAELATRYDTEGMPAFSLASAESTLASATASLAAELAPVVASSQELAELTGRVALMTAQASSLVRSPAAALSGFHDAITGLADTIIAAPGALLAALVRAYLADFGPEVVAITATRARERANQLAMAAALRSILVIEAARLAPSVPFESVDQATAARDQIAELLEEQAEAAGDDAYPALVDLRSKVLRAVPGESDFARVLTATRNVAIPSLLLAYQLYGSVDLEPDLVARNGIRHPGFVSGELKVLSNA